MLLLTREINEKVMVGDNIEVKIIAVNGLKVTLGFNAPKQIPVHREEIYNRIKEHKRIHDSNEFGTISTELNLT